MQNQVALGGFPIDMVYWRPGLYTKDLFNVNGLHLKVKHSDMGRISCSKHAGGNEAKLCLKSLLCHIHISAEKQGFVFLLHKILWGIQGQLQDKQQ